MQESGMFLFCRWPVLCNPKTVKRNPLSVVPPLGRNTLPIQVALL